MKNMFLGSSGNLPNIKIKMKNQLQPSNLQEQDERMDCDVSREKFKLLKNPLNPLTL